MPLVCMHILISLAPQRSIVAAPTSQGNHQRGLQADGPSIVLVTSADRLVLIKVTVKVTSWPACDSSPPFYIPTQPCSGTCPAAVRVPAPPDLSEDRRGWPWQVLKPVHRARHSPGSFTRSQSLSPEIGMGFLRSQHGLSQGRQDSFQGRLVRSSWGGQPKCRLDFWGVQT